MDLNAYGETPEGQNLGGKPHSMAETTPVLPPYYRYGGFCACCQHGDRESEDGAHNDVICKKAAAGANFRSGLFNITCGTLCAPNRWREHSGVLREDFYQAETDIRNDIC